MWPSRVPQSGFGAQDLPQSLASVWGNRPQQAGDDFQHLLCHGAAVFTRFVGAVEGVHQFHHRGNGGVELLTAVVIIADFGYGGVQLEAQVFQACIQTVLAA